MIAAAVLLILALPTPLMLGQTQPDASPTASQPPASQPDTDATTAFLDRLEKVEQSIDTISTTIRYETIQGLLGDNQVRKGHAFLRILDGRKTRQFRVEFTSYQTSRGIEDERRVYIFDGRYLVEQLDRDRDFIKREIARPGEAVDPLSIDGPFPLPIGQARAQIEKRFTAELLDPEPDDEDRLAGYLRLHLTAKDEDDDLDRVDLWYNPQTLLPGRAIITERGGDVVKVDLSKDITVNGDVDPGLFSTKTPPLEEGWHVDIQNLDLANPNEKK